MNDGGSSYLLAQLGYQIPLLLVYFVAAVLALVFISRAPMASTLTLLGAGILIVATVGLVVAQASLMSARGDGLRDPDEFSRLMRIAAIIGICVRAGGLSLFVAAIFVGRSK